MIHPLRRVPICYRKTSLLRVFLEACQIFDQSDQHDLHAELRKQLAQLSRGTCGVRLTHVKLLVWHWSGCENFLSRGVCFSAWKHVYTSYVDCKWLMLLIRITQWKVICELKLLKQLLETFSGSFWTTLNPKRVKISLHGDVKEGYSAFFYFKYRDELMKSFNPPHSFTPDKP